MSEAEPRVGTIRHARTNLSDIVKTVDATGEHYTVGAYRTPKAVIVPAAHAIPQAVVDDVFAAAADTAGAVLADQQALPAGIPELLTWWSSLTPAPAELGTFLENIVAAVDATLDGDGDTTARDVICSYTGWSRNDWKAYRALTTVGGESPDPIAQSADPT